MITALAYLKEVLSNYTDTEELGRSIYRKLEQEHYSTELSFVRELTEEETSFLNNILPDEIEYANNEQDEVRAEQLNEVYELLL